MILVIGSLAYDAAGRTAAGRTAAIAREVARRQRRVEVVARIGDDEAGDQLLLALARDGVGHVAVLRDAGRATALAVLEDASPGSERPVVEELLEDEAASQLPVARDGPRLQPNDVALAIEYLDGVQLVVVDVGDDASTVRASVTGAEFHGAHVLALLPNSAKSPALAGVTQLLVPPESRDSAVPAVIATLAVAMHDGADPGDALSGLVARP